MVTAMILYLAFRFTLHQGLDSSCVLVQHDSEKLLSLHPSTAAEEISRWPFSAEDWLALFFRATFNSCFTKENKRENASAAGTFSINVCQFLAVASQLRRSYSIQDQLTANSFHSTDWINNICTGNTPLKSSVCWSSKYLCCDSWLNKQTETTVQLT